MEESPRDPFALTADPQAYIPTRALEGALDAATAALNRAKCPAIVGPTGLGKTLVLRVLAHQLEGRGRSLYVPFSTLEPVDFAALVLGLLERPSDGDAEEAFVEEIATQYARKAPLLLLIDDAAGLPIETASALYDWVEAADGALLLALAGLPGDELDEVLLRLGECVEPIALDEGFGDEEVALYVEKKLAGSELSPEVQAAFDEAAVASLRDEAQGNPRQLNLAAQAFVRKLEDAAEGVSESVLASAAPVPEEEQEPEFDFGPPPVEPAADEPAPEVEPEPEAEPAPETSPEDAAEDDVLAADLVNVGEYRLVAGRVAEQRVQAESLAESPPAEVAASAIEPEPAPLLAESEPESGTDAPGFDFEAVTLPTPEEGGEARTSLGQIDLALGAATAQTERLSVSPESALPPLGSHAESDAKPFPTRSVAIAVALVAALLGAFVSTQLFGGRDTASPPAVVPFDPPRPVAELNRAPEPAPAVKPAPPAAEKAEPTPEPPKPADPKPAAAKAKPAAAPTVAPPKPAPAEPKAPVTPTVAPAEPSAEKEIPLISVSINATPWAVIEIDGQPMGETPLSGVLLSEGPHEFRALMADGTVQTDTITIDEDRKTVVFD